MTLQTSRCLLLRSIVVGLIVVLGCIIAGDPSSAQVEYRVAVIEGDLLGVSSPECNVESYERVSYHYPSGTQVAIRASTDPALTVSLDDSVNVRLIDFRGSRSPGMRAIIAELVPSAAVLNRAVDFRRSFPRCDLLITLNGKAVGVERRGTDWSQHLPGGSFSSMETADRAFSKHRVSVRHEVPSAAELKAQEDFWEWRKQKDLWDFHCDLTIRETIRTKNPELYEALTKTPAPDCQSPPTMREAGYPNYRE